MWHSHSWLCSFDVSPHTGAHRQACLCHKPTAKPCCLQTPCCTPHPQSPLPQSAPPRTATTAAAPSRPQTPPAPCCAPDSPKDSSQESRSGESASASSLSPLPQIPPEPACPSPRESPAKRKTSAPLPPQSTPAANTRPAS